MRIDSRSIALLIDLDGFSTARRARGSEDVVSDVTTLMRCVRREHGASRIVFRRGYADLAAEGASFGREAAARHGLELVHVNSATQAGGAALLRMALDAVQLASGGGGRIDEIVLVCGSADLEPLLVDLRGRGVLSTLIGVSGATPDTLRAYCDGFELFEELVQTVGLAAEADLGAMRGAVVEILARRRPLPSAVLEEQLAKSLGRPFDAGAFGVGSWVEFLNENAELFGVEIRREDGEALVDLAGGALPTPLRGRPREPRHTVVEYRNLLRLRNPRVHLTTRDDWLEISRLFFEIAGGTLGERPNVLQQELTDEVIRQAVDAGVDAPEKKVQAIVFQLFKCGAFVCAEPGAEGDTDFHWSRPARLADAATDLEAMRDMARVYIARILLERMQSEFGNVEVDAEVFTEMLEGGDPDEERIDRMEELLDRAEEQLTVRP